MTTVYILNKNNKPLMPCHNGAFIRKILKDKKAKVVKREPFTIKLLVDVKNNYTQPITLGVDAGYTYIGLSSTTPKKELFSAEVKQDCEIVERNKERRMYRRQRRNRLRYRKAKFNNRKKDKGWLAPSLIRKKDTHLKMINMICNIMPITSIRVEIGLFDPALMKATSEGKTLKNEDYQHGEQEGFENIKSYIRYRDNYTCQNPDCVCHKMKEEDRKKLKLFIHHLGYWKKDRSNRPSNLITLCELSHTQENHQVGHLLYGWKPKLKSLKEPAFMNIVRKEIAEELKDLYPNKDIHYCYGYTTNITRNAWGVSKSHHDDAFCITKIKSKQRADMIYYFKQHKRNNRSLEIFYDAKYIDARDDKKKSGKELFNGRTLRNKNFNTENLHQYRKEKVSKGKRNIRRSHYPYQPNDIVIYQDKKHKIKGSQHYGQYILLDNKLSVSVKKVRPYKYAGGIYLDRKERQFLPLMNQLVPLPELSMNKMIVNVKGGQIVASVSTDPDYPGIDLEFVPDVEDLESLSRFRVLME